MTTIAEGLSAISTALGIVKTLRDIDRGVQEAEYKLQVAAMTERLAEAKLALVDAQDELRAREFELDQARSAIRFRADETILKDGFLFRKVADKPVGRAFCSVCSDDGRFIHLNIVATKDGQSYQCPRCKAFFGWRVPVFGEA